MNSGTVRFVHRPIADEANGGENGSGQEEKSPLIDRSTDVKRETMPRAGWFGALLSRWFGSAGPTRPRFEGRKLDPQRWLPKE